MVDLRERWWLNELAGGAQVRGGLDHYAHVLNQHKILVVG
jgi:hypothetical protein